jgi:hypothetical protein
MGSLRGDKLRLGGLTRGVGRFKPVISPIITALRNALPRRAIDDGE